MKKLLLILCSTLILGSMAWSQSATTDPPLKTWWSSNRAASTNLVGQNKLRAIPGFTNGGRLQTNSDSTWSAYITAGQADSVVVGMFIDTVWTIPTNGWIQFGTIYRDKSNRVGREELKIQFVKDSSILTGNGYQGRINTYTGSDKRLDLHRITSNSTTSPTQTSAYYWIPVAGVNGGYTVPGVVNDTVIVRFYWDHRKTIYRKYGAVVDSTSGVDSTNVGAKIQSGYIRFLAQFYDAAPLTKWRHILYSTSADNYVYVPPGDADSIPPVVLFQGANPSGVPYTRTQTFSISATDNHSITKMICYIDGLEFDSAVYVAVGNRTASFTTDPKSWVLANVGSHSFNWKVIDSTGNFTTTNQVDFSVTDTSVSTPRAFNWVSGYVKSWTINTGTHESGYGDGPVHRDSIDWSAMTHVIMFAAAVGADGSIAYNNLSPLKRGPMNDYLHARGKPVILSIGGAGNNTFQTAISTAPLRATLAHNLMVAKRTERYDGFDIDIEPYAPSADSTNMRLFVMGLRDSMNTETAFYDNTKPLILTAAIYNGQTSWARIANYFDQINCMTYDFMGSWLGRSWHNNVAKGGASDNDIYGVPMTTVATKILQSIAIPRNKLGVGVDFNGYVWQGGTALTGLNGTPTGQGILNPREYWSTPPVHPGAPFNVEVTYYDLKRYYIDTVLTNHPSWYGYDNVAKAPYIGIDNPGSANDRYINWQDTSTVRTIIQLAADSSARGLIIWDVAAGYITPTYFPSYIGRRDDLLQAVKTYAMSGTPLPPDPLPGAVTLVSPSNAATNQEALGATFRWRTATQAASYQLSYATNSSFTGATTVTSTDTFYVSPISPNPDVPLFPYGSTVYWRVRGVNQSGYGTYSSTYSFTVRTRTVSVPAAPTLSYPANGGTDIPTQFNLVWSNSATDTISDHEIQLSYNVGFTGVLFYQDSVNVFSPYPAGPLVQGATYYWRVRAKNGSGWSSWSTVRSFTVTSGPPVSTGVGIFPRWRTSASAQYNTQSPPPYYTVRIATESEVVNAPTVNDMNFWTDGYAWYLKPSTGNSIQISGTGGGGGNITGQSVNDALNTLSTIAFTAPLSLTGVPTLPSGRFILTSDTAITVSTPTSTRSQILTENNNFRDTNGVIISASPGYLATWISEDSLGSSTLPVTRIDSLITLSRMEDSISAALGGMSLTWVQDSLNKKMNIADSTAYATRKWVLDNLGSDTTLITGSAAFSGSATVDTIIVSLRNINMFVATPKLLARADTLSPADSRLSHFISGDTVYVHRGAASDNKANLAYSYTLVKGSAFDPYAGVDTTKPDTTGLRLWVSTRYKTGETNGDTVTFLADSSGQGNHLRQDLTLTRAPTWVAADTAVAIRMTGSTATTQFLRADSLSSTFRGVDPQYMIQMVIQLDSGWRTGTYQNQQDIWSFGQSGGGGANPPYAGFMQSYLYWSAYGPPPTYRIYTTGRADDSTASSAYTYGMWDASSDTTGYMNGYVVLTWIRSNDSTVLYRNTTRITNSGSAYAAGLEKFWKLNTFTLGGLRNHQSNNTSTGFPSSYKFKDLIVYPKEATIDYQKMYKNIARMRTRYGI